MIVSSLPPEISTCSDGARWQPPISQYSTVDSLESARQQKMCRTGPRMYERQVLKVNEMPGPGNGDGTGSGCP